MSTLRAVDGLKYYNSDIILRLYYYNPSSMLLCVDDYVRLDLHSCVCFSITFKHRLLPSASRPPAAGRLCHACPTQQPSVSPAKERAPQPNSAGGECRKLPSQGWQIFAILYFGSAVERSTQEVRSVGSNPPFSAFFLFCCGGVNG